MKRFKQTGIWFFSYVFTFVICIITGQIITGFSERILSNQIEETIEIAFESKINTVQNRIESQQTSMYAVLGGSDVVSLANRYLKPDRVTRSNLVKGVMDAMSVQFTNSGYSEENYICFDNLDIVVSSGENYNKEQAFKNHFARIYKTQEEWLDDIFDFQGMVKFFSFKDTQGHVKIVIVQKEVRNIGAKARVVGISVIDERKLLEGMFNDPICKTFILANGKQFCSSGADDFYETVTENGAFVEYGGESYIQYTRQEGTLQYIQLFSNETHTRRLNAVKRTGMIINLIILIFGIFISYVFTKINYKPLSRVASSLKIDSSDENEFVAIEKGIENILQNRNSVIKQLNEKDRRLYEAYNRMLLDASTKDDVKVIVENFPVTFKHRYFAIEVFRIDDAGVIVDNKIKKNESVELSTFCILNVFKELLPNDISCDHCIINNECHCILNFTRTSYIEEIEKISENICAFFEENFKMKITYFVSGDGAISSIPKMRDEIQMLSEFSEILDGYNGFMYKKYANYLIELYNAFYNSELISAVEENSVTEAVRIINGFVNRVMLGNVGGFSNENIFRKTLLNTYLNISGSNADTDLVNTIFNEDCDIEKMKLEFTKLYKSLIMNTRNLSENSNKKIQMIIDIIESNYFDDKLNVSYISEKMNMNISQLSRFFKNNTNEGLADFILRYRCNKAAQMLDNQSEMTVAEVGKRCGFSSSISFIRAFKRIYDTTPGKYANKEAE